MTIRRALRAIIGGSGAMGLAIGIAGLQGVGAQGAGCGSYPSYSALASAAAQRTSIAAPGLLPVNEADHALPESQAEFDSRIGSLAHAGAPYSEIVAGNVGLTGVNANDVPVFAVARHPTDPKVEKSTPASTLTAEADADSAAARTEGGTNAASAGRVATSALAQCDDGGSIEAVAENRVELLNVDGVVRLGLVRSHARAIVDENGKPTLQGTMEVEGATVLGQRVAITDQGLVVGSSPAPLPADDPIATALADAGIAVRFIAAEQDPEQGQVFAPGLEIAVTRRVEGAGTGPAVTTITLGRAYARASLASDGPTAVPTGVAPSDADLGVAPSADEQLSAGIDSLAPPTLPSSGVATRGQQVPVSRGSAGLAAWSIARAYTALGLGVLLMAFSLVGWRSLGATLGRPKAGTQAQS